MKSLAGMAIITWAMLSGCTHSRVLPPKSPVCKAPHGATIPGVNPSHRASAYWLERLASNELDRVLMTPRSIDGLNTRNQANAAAFQDVTRAGFVNEERHKSEILERFEWLRKRLETGKYVASPTDMLTHAIARASEATVSNEIRLIHQETTLYCIPSRDGLYTLPIDKDFNRNHCSGLHPGEMARMLRITSDGWSYVHVGHSVGWVRTKTLTPSVSLKEALHYKNHSPRAVVMSDRLTIDDTNTLRWGTHVPLLSVDATEGFRILAPTADGIKAFVVPPTASLRQGPLPLTRRNVFTLAMAMQDAPYGWGGRQGGRDCSRFLLDLFGAFGLQFGRHSAAQSTAGHYTVELTGLTPAEKQLAIRKATERGLVLLYMPGHIMLYVGETDDDVFAISSLSEYLVPCKAHGHDIVRVDRVAVTTLELGYGTERTAFIERLHRLAVFGP
jgi:hypothetical protein